MSPEAIARCMRNWRDGADSFLAEVFADQGPATRAHCETALARLCDARLLAAKLSGELGERRWRGLGRVLVVVSENDILGTAFAMIGACLTGNAMRIKVRSTQALVEELKRALDLSDERCELLNWSSLDQDDDELLRGIDAVLLAGGEDLIAHYRRVTPVGVRIIEYGPKLSCAVVGGEASLPAAIDGLLADVSLFGQKVCSSPHFILTEGAELGARLFEMLIPRLQELHPISDEERLSQYSRYRELELWNRLEGQGRCHLDSETGWGVTLSSRLNPGGWLPRGFQVVTGNLVELLPEVHHRYRHHLQSAGVHGLSADAREAITGFTRICPIGKMHERSPLEPHDGMLELPPLVEFLS